VEQLELERNGKREARLSSRSHVKKMKREVKRELLDELPPADPRAIWSRRDLRRINACMAQASIMARLLGGALNDGPPCTSPRTIADLGGGDGTLLLQLAKRMASRWKSMRAIVVDRQSILSSRTKAEFNAISWQVESVESDIFDWLESSHPQLIDITVTSLFLHHFKEGPLHSLLERAAEQTKLFAACEPRRATFPYLASSLLGFIGCNSVTRHDAKVSVRAGFARQELSALWPAGNAWRLREMEAGLFSHCFLAQRINGPIV
jgi:hypothetical protein